MNDEEMIGMALTGGLGYRVEISRYVDDACDISILHVGKQGK